MTIHPIDWSILIRSTLISIGIVDAIEISIKIIDIITKIKLYSKQPIQSFRIREILQYVINKFITINYY